MKLEDNQSQIKCASFQRNLSTNRHEQYQVKANNGGNLHCNYDGSHKQVHHKSFPKDINNYDKQQKLYNWNNIYDDECVQSLNKMKLLTEIMECMTIDMLVDIIENQESRSYEEQKKPSSGEVISENSQEDDDISKLPTTPSKNLLNYFFLNKKIRD